jgi:hypothetical protein
MHPALSLAKRKLEDARTEFDQLIAIEAEIIPVIAEKASPAAAIAKTSLRATGIEGVYTGMEGVLKEILTVVDGGVFSGPESWHAHLLAQAGEPNPQNGRTTIISERVYHLLDQLRMFRHVERNIYRHLFRATDVDENLSRLQDVFPLFEMEIALFLRDFDGDRNGGSPPTPSGSGEFPGAAS